MPFAWKRKRLRDFLCTSDFLLTRWLFSSLTQFPLLFGKNIRFAMKTNIQPEIDSLHLISKKRFYFQRLHIRHTLNPYSWCECINKLLFGFGKCSGVEFRRKIWIKSRKSMHRLNFSSQTGHYSNWILHELYEAKKFVERSLEML